MGRYELDTSQAAMLRPVYQKTDGDFYIYYTGQSSEGLLLYFIQVVVNLSFMNETLPETKSSQL